jgi:hypothetical protein
LLGILGNNNAQKNLAKAINFNKVGLMDKIVP